MILKNHYPHKKILKNHYPTKIFPKNHYPTPTKKKNHYPTPQKKLEITTHRFNTTKFQKFAWNHESEWIFCCVSMYITLFSPLVNVDFEGEGTLTRNFRKFLWNHKSESKFCLCLHIYHTFLTP